MNGEVERLSASLDGIGDQLPGWDEPTGDRDLAVDRFIDEALNLNSGGLLALGAAVDRQRRPLLYRCSVRAASRAASTYDPARCKAALATLLITQHTPRDPRDLMVDLAPHHVAATRVIGQAGRLFEWAADQARAETADTLRAFGARADVSLEAFAWKEVMNSNGTWFVLNW